MPVLPDLPACLMIDLTGSDRCPDDGQAQPKCATIITMDNAFQEIKATKATIFMDVDLERDV